MADIDPDELHKKFFNPDDVSHWSNHSLEEFISTIHGELHHANLCIQMAAKSLSSNGPWGTEIDFSKLDPDVQTQLHEILKYASRIERVLSTASSRISGKK